MLVELEGVSKVYTQGWVSICALSDIELQIDRGEFVAVTGPSGAGKSTLLRIIACLDRPTTGMYRLDGQEIQAVSKAQQARIRSERIGYLSEYPHLISDLTVAENVEVPLVFRGISRVQRRELVEKALNRVGLQDRMNHLPGHLSIGQQQRVALARAIVAQPEIVVADEPTGRLNTRSGRELMEMLLQINRSGTCVVLATHDADLADMAERTIDLVDGRIVT
ncbi:MAG: ABC transporter ATP-binding protein [Firmicutes bacterium]|nr:ABC transporter ATP-binding protein [Bacillota bacterium]HQD17740.1 ABC transporter ATP-binding protein [Bacillota bacterium]